MSGGGGPVSTKGGTSRVLCKVVGAAGGAAAVDVFVAERSVRRGGVGEGGATASATCPFRANGAIVLIKYPEINP